MWALRARPQIPELLADTFSSRQYGDWPWTTREMAHLDKILSPWPSHYPNLRFCFRNVTNRKLQKNNMLLVDIHSFLSVSLATPRLTLSRYCEDSLINFLLITTFINCRPEGYWENCNIVGSLNLAACLAGTEPGNFRFLRDALTH